MMFKIKKVHLFTLGILILINVFFMVEVKAEENEAVVIYDTYNEFGSEENKLNCLVRLILSTGSGVDIINTNSYFQDSIDKYKVMFVMYNNASELPKDFIENLLKFKGKIVWIGKNFKSSLESKENISYVKNFSCKDERYSVLRKESYKFINEGEFKNKNTYLFIDKIYPFTDHREFIKKVDFLYDNGISFICSVMPVYENESIDDMKGFCQVLRYAQSKGGIIILHYPVLYDENLSGKDVKEKMSLAQQIYIKCGVYPLSLHIPEELLYKEDYKNLIHSTNSIFIENDKQIGILDLKKYSIGKFQTVIDKIDIKDEYRYNKPENIYNVAFSFNVDLDLNNFKSGVNKIINKGIYFSDVNYLDTTVKLGGVELRLNKSNILLNNKTVTGENFISKPSIEAKSKSKTIDIGGIYGGITKITIVICFIFTVIVLISIRIDRKKFFK